MFGLHPPSAEYAMPALQKLFFFFFLTTSELKAAKELAIQNADPSVNPAGRQQMQSSERDGIVC